MGSKIVVGHRICDDALAQLSAVGEVVMNEGPEPFDDRELAAQCADAVALMAFMTERVGADLLDACARLRIVAGALKGANNIDVDAATARGVAVTVVPDLLTAPTAELAVGLTISVMRHLVSGNQLVRSGEFKGWRPMLYGTSLDGATVGVIGAGAVGRAIMKRLGGFGAALVFTDPSHHADVAGARPVTLAALLREADVVILAVPLLADTAGMVDEVFLAEMKKGAVLINPARGSLVDEAAVAAALANGQIGGYGADVFAFEDWSQPDRPGAVHPGLLAARNVVLTPHIGSAVRDVRAAIESSAADSIVAVLRGEIPPTAVNGSDLARRTA